jgi:glycosyltransferase involved in cell wall biosynthesis
MRRLLLISSDIIGERMAGPGIRFWEIARALSQHYEVALAVPNLDPPPHPNVEIHSYGHRPEELRELARSTDAIILQGFALHFYPFLKELGIPLIVDIYDPFVLESIQVHSRKRSVKERLLLHTQDLSVLNDQLRIGDFFICANERQRDLWLGMLLALGRVNPYTYDADETLRKLIDVVPFGTSSTPPRHTRQVLKGVYKTIRREDKVILWGGGVWNWFDPCTLIRAMAQIVERRDDVKLFFMGVRHPNRLIAEMGRVTEAIGLSKSLGLHDGYVFFNEWVPYEARQDYLLEADIGVSLHLDHVETRFSFRTRLLDYIWAGLPIVTTRGDSISQLVERHGLGRVVDYQDVEGVAEALLGLLSTPALREAHQPHFEQVRGQLTWDRVVAPLVSFCANPCLAPDKGALGLHHQAVSLHREGGTRLLQWSLLARKSWRVLRHAGPRALYRQARLYLHM